MIDHWDCDGTHDIVVKLHEYRGRRLLEIRKYRRTQGDMGWVH
jgi:hypothetical protein